jgi:hypothetical protein
MSRELAPSRPGRMRWLVRGWREPTRIPGTSRGQSNETALVARHPRRPGGVPPRAGVGRYPPLSRPPTPPSTPADTVTDTTTVTAGRRHVTLGGLSRRTMARLYADDYPSISIGQLGPMSPGECRQERLLAASRADAELLASEQTRKHEIVSNKRCCRRRAHGRCNSSLSMMHYASSTDIKALAALHHLHAR